MNPNLASAAADAQRALNTGARSPDLYSTLGWFALQSGDVDLAQQQFGHALGLSPSDPEALTGMAQCLRLQGQLRDAILHCDAAIRANPDYADAWLERGFVFASGGSMPSAKACYQKVIDIDPAQAAAHAGIASIMARDGDSAEGRAHAAQALSIDPHNAIAAAALATMQIESGEAVAAQALITGVLAILTEPDADRAMLLGLLGDACNRLGETAMACDSYAQSKQLFAAIHAPRFQGRETHREYLDGIGRQLAAMPVRHPVPADIAPA